MMGAKHDNGKADYTLLPLLDLENVVRVMEFGAQKYQRDSWREVPDGERRYLAATMRHIALHLSGEVMDDESQLAHIDHAACSLIFAMALRAQKQEVNHVQHRPSRKNARNRTKTTVRATATKQRNRAR